MADNILATGTDNTRHMHTFCSLSLAAFVDRLVLDNILTYRFYFHNRPHDASKLQCSIHTNVLKQRIQKIMLNLLHATNIYFEECGAIRAGVFADKQIELKPLC